MPEIRVLSQETADKIAAGEVAERPSSVVKELVENSIDAGADSIEVEIRKGGIAYIRITDNGCGIEPEQAETAFLRHATSKIRSVDDLYKIGSMGFRGEALSSICAVAAVELITKTKENDEGVFLRMMHGEATEKEPIACADGTTIVVNNLFENVPARMKFLKKDSTEAGYVTDTLGRIALSRPDISFSYICDGKEIFSTSGDGSLKNTILKIYGIDHAKAVIDTDYSEDGISVSGVVGKPEIARGNRTRQTLLVNGRYIKSHVVSKIVSEGYRNSVMVGKFPFFVLNINVPPDCVDVNVHPAKTEVKFANESKVYEVVYHAVANALGHTERKADAEAKLNDVIDEKPHEQINMVQSVKENDVGQKSVRNGFSGSYKDGRFGEKVDSGIVREYLGTFSDEKKVLKDFEREVFDSTKPLFMNEPKKDSDFVPKEEEASPSVKKEELDEITEVTVPDDTFKTVGQVFDTYIICEKGDIFYLIDQHAAHERLRFEKLKKDYYNGERMSQLMLTPMIFKPDFGEVDTILSNLEIFNRFGFEIEDFGSGSIIVHSTPIIGSEKEVQDLILEICGAIDEMGSCSVAEFEERALDMIACKYAIKANHRLNTAEMNDLTAKVFGLEKEGIKTCPHGRPIKIEFSKKDVEKMFKRRV